MSGCHFWVAVSHPCLPEAQSFGKWLMKRGLEEGLTWPHTPDLSSACSGATPNSSIEMEKNHKALYRQIFNPLAFPWILAFSSSSGSSSMGEQTGKQEHMCPKCTTALCATGRDPAHHLPYLQPSLAPAIPTASLQIPPPPCHGAGLQQQQVYGVGWLGITSFWFSRPLTSIASCVTWGKGRIKGSFLPIFFHHGNKVCNKVGPALRPSCKLMNMVFVPVKSKKMGQIWEQQGRPQLAYTTALSQLPWFSSFSLFISLDVSFSPKRLFKIAFAIGSIIAVEAVLLNHMDRKDVVNIIPKISLKERKKEKLNFFSLARSLTH